MFLASAAKPIDDNLKSLVDKIEAQSSSLSVLAARQFRYSLYQTPIEVTIKEARRFNLLEEFILRAGIEFNPPLTSDELATVLGLDPVFLRSTVITLQSLQVLAVNSQINVTSEGRLFYENGSVPQPPYSLQIYGISDPLEEKNIFQYEPLDSFDKSLLALPDLADFVKNAIKDNQINTLSIDELQQLIQASSLSLHNPEEGKVISFCSITSSSQIIWRSIAIFVIFDANHDKLSIQIRSGNKILESASNKLELLLSEGIISLQSLLYLSDNIINLEREATLKRRNDEVESRLEKIRNQAIIIANKTSFSQDNLSAIGTAIQLRDQQIAQAFLEVLKSAKRQVLIYSPWVSHAVVDEKFLNILQTLVNRGVWILIGHGIARRQEDEDRPIPPEIEAKLQAIKTPDGIPGVQIFWLGDSHVKEVIVDQEIHLCGSHNWLSYRGDYLPRGESVYKVTIPNQVQEAYNFLSHRFQNHAQKLWQKSIEARDIPMAINSLCVWASLGMEDLALSKIQNHNCLELLPVWAKIKAHTGRSLSK
ncbi:hypothetical protein H6G76_30725 [Nostoc sp. FACHB-152]|uniref:hypothetical protein n=1 Tax=Nostoc sp. FACHB-152 TaxID=2692837 RepID=UPI00168862D2|nr:hypothetical protein [Nostoc sp. FACHB-152]MBD2451422.1 hypothetical protein [Nostoc sp. FACHB-152]